MTGDMDERGIQDRTDALTDRMWNRMIWGYIGFASIICGAMLLDYPPSKSLFAVSLTCLIPWAISAYRVARWTRHLNAETRRRGRGWAQS